MMNMENKGVYLRLASDRGRSTKVGRGGEDFYGESHFNEMLNLEKKRSQRSMRPLMLMRLDVSCLMETNPSDARLKLEQALASGIRETDVRGWCTQGAVVGIVFTELESAGPAMQDLLIRRVITRLVNQIDAEVLFRVTVTCHMFPEDEAHGQSRRSLRVGRPQDFAKKTVRRDLSSRVKVLKDIVGHLLMT